METAPSEGQAQMEVEAPAVEEMPSDEAITNMTVQLLTSDAEVMAQYNSGSLTVRVLLTAVAARMGVREPTKAMKFVVKSALIDYMAQFQEPDEEEAAPAAPAAPRAKARGGGGKRTDKVVDPAGLKAKMDADSWAVTEKPRPGSEEKKGKHVDKYYRKPGDGKQYRSLLEIARAYYPECLGGLCMVRAVYWPVAYWAAILTRHQ